MSWSVDNFRSWTTTILGLWLIIADAVLLLVGVWTDKFHNWTAYTASGALLMLMVGLWLLGIKDFNPWKYLPWVKR